MLPKTGLWQHEDFRRLWSAQALSAYGSRITRTALPIIAVATLKQPDAMVGVLMALQLAPGIPVAMFAGGFIDRSDKRRILIVADLLRAAVVGSLTLAWAVGVLSIIHVIIVGMVVGGASALFQIADTTYLPVLIGRRHLAEGNSKLESTEAVAEITGPASAGYLIALLGAPLAVVIDALSYVWSALLLGRIRMAEPGPVPSPPRPLVGAGVGVIAAPPRRLGDDLRIGMRIVFGQPVVRALVLSHMVWSIAGGFFMALYTPYCLRVLNLSEGAFGLVISMGGIGSLAGALISRRLVAWMGLGKTLVVTSSISLACALLIPLAGSPLFAGHRHVMLVLLGTHQLVSDGFAVAYIIQAVTLRQTVLPKEYLGRANAAIHVCTQGVLPVAALLAGGLAMLVGTRTAVTVGVVTGLIAPVFLLTLRHLKEMPPSISIEMLAAQSGPLEVIR